MTHDLESLDGDTARVELKMSPLQRDRLDYMPQIPDALRNLSELDFTETDMVSAQAAVRPLFLQLSNSRNITFTRKETASRPLKVGVVLSGGQAAGGHNVIAGIFDALQELNPQSSLIGFLNGPGGIVRNKSIEITKEMLQPYRNQGGFDIIGSGRTKIDSEEQFRAAGHAIHENELDGLVIIGGDDSNTNGAFLAEYLKKYQSKACIVGVPKTIDGDLQNEAIEIPFGFDSACKVFSETIGNIARDCLSAKKYYYFIKLMGRSASHITLECALNTQPNLALIGEEIQDKQKTLADVVTMLVDLVRERAKRGLEYGVVLVPEGIIEFMPDIKALIRELNTLLAKGGQHLAALAHLPSAQEKINHVIGVLPEAVQETYKSLPADIQLQLLLDRDPHGNVQVSKIETERLLITLTARVLKKIDPSIKFSCQPIFCGYEGRSCLPSNFDATYCYSLGRIAALLIARGRTGYIASLGELARPFEDWVPRATHIISMLHMEEREGKEKAVIEKALVKLDSKAFLEFSRLRQSWRLKDQYSQPGPMQFAGPRELIDSIPTTLKLNHGPS